MLQLKPALGRLFTPDDDRVVGANYVAVLSYDYWSVHLGSDPGVIGQQITVNGHPMTIIGVAERGFQGTTLGVTPVVFVPISMRDVMMPAFRSIENRQGYWIYLFGRLAPGIPMERAATMINGVYHPIITDIEAPLQKGMSDATMVQFKAKKVLLADGSRGQSSIHTDAHRPLILLFATTGVVLLIACANIANLLLARGASRSLEMAVRLSLGATRWQILSQLLVESCLLAVLGGVASLLVAHWTLGLISALLPVDTAATFHFALRPSVILYTAVLSLGTGIVFGLFPAVNNTRPDLASTIRAGTGKHSGARAAARFRSALVTAQIALSMALLISAGLFIRSLDNVSHVDLGMRIDHLVTFGLQPQLKGYDHAHSRQLFARVEQEMAALPGVTSVGASMVPLLSGSNWGTDVSVEGFRKGPDTDANSRYNEVSAGYVHTLGMSLMSGREFTPADEAGAPKVAIVNQAFAKKFGLGSSPVGKRMSDGGDTLDIEIVGLVRDAKYSEVKQQAPPLFFRPVLQDTAAGWLTFYVRTAGNAATLMPTIRTIMKRIDPTLPVDNLKTMEQQAKENVFLDRMISTLSAGFAALATLLAAIGLYGVLAYSIAQRTREIGVRMALGADGGRVQRMVLKQVGLMTLVGGAIGVVAALAFGRALTVLLYEIKAHDPVVFVASVLVLSAVAMLAGYIPALRASRIDPVQALRYE